MREVRSKWITPSVFKFVNAKNEPLADVKNLFNRVFKENASIRDNNALLLTKSGKQLIVSLTVSPILDEDNNINAAVAIFRDVSKERQEEQQRADFISTASHEMRTPIAAIEGYLSLTLNDKVATIDARARSFIEKAYSSTRHLGELFQDLLTSAKAEDGRLTSHPRIVEMGEFIEALVEDLRFTAEGKGLTLDFVIGSGAVIDASSTKTIRPLYYLNIDPDRLREVVSNLFTNAVKYTDGGRITLGLTGNNDIVQIYVRDTGHGISPEDIPHLFQKFYRVDSSATRTIGGTGLGLFICRKIVEMYQGRIWVESDVGKGSTFYINLPRVNTEQAEALHQQEALQAVQGTAALPAK